ncbi:MAG: hypothetical protein K2X82_06070 [Gemmataceae bacterium]|nr:hypothetical protein [Gemmataceae bacterium]
MTRLRATPLVLAALTALAAGCSGPPNAPVDADVARDTLRTALDSWKRGEKADALQGGSPPIYVIDQEWQAGAVLKDYKLAGDGQAMDASLFCPVVLTVRAPGGSDVTREVTFIVSTAPNRTVSRKVF